jgi:hypothetical protein
MHDMKKHTKMLSFRLPATMVRDLRSEASLYNCSVGDVIREALRQYFARPPLDARGTSWLTRAVGAPATPHMPPVRGGRK